MDVEQQTMLVSGLVTAVLATAATLFTSATSRRTQQTKVDAEASLRASEVYVAMVNELQEEVTALRRENSALRAELYARRRRRQDTDT